NSYEGVAIGYPAIGPSGVPDESTVTFGSGNDFTENVETGVTVVGNAVVTGTDGVDGTFDWTGAGGDNAPSGADLSDTLRGGDGDDDLTGFGGDDTLDGGAGIDMAHYAASLDAADIVPNGAGGWTVTTGGEGTDTLSDIEIVAGAGGARFLLVGNGGFDTIQAAIDAAVDGDTILIAAGTYAENVVIDRAVYLKGQDGVIIDPPSGNAVTLSGNLGGHDVAIDNVDMTGGANGLFVATNANGGKLTILNSAITGNAEHGVYLVGDDPENDGNAPIVAGVAAIEIIDTTFANNGFDNNYKGSGHIKLFGYQGNALFQNVAIEGAPDGTAQNDRPDNAIE